MSESRASRWFTDEGPGLDRFGVVLGLSILSVTVLSLIDLDDTSAGIRSEIGWVIVTLTVIATLIAALRASGVAKRPRRVVEFLLVLGTITTILVLVLSRIVDGGDAGNVASSRPSLLWTATAALSPVLVLRRVMLQTKITLATLLGALSVYLLVALAFNYAFLGVEGIGGSEPFFGSPETTSTFMYFSLSTITTVGYGDLAAVGDVGRFLASAEAVIGQVLLVTVVARLVSLYSRTPEPVEAAAGQSSTVTVE